MIHTTFFKFARAVFLSLLLVVIAGVVSADSPSQRVPQAGPLYDDLLIGVPFEGIGAAAGAGDVRRALGQFNGFLINIAQTVQESTAVANNNFGKAIATGDFNGDGYTDVAFGIPGASDLKTDSGAVIVKMGATDGSISSSGFGIKPRGSVNNYETAFGEFGEVLAVGDFNGDGFDDLAIGHPKYDYNYGAGVYDQAGYVHIYTGHSGGINQDPSLTFHKESDNSSTGNRNSERFGSALTTGDYNNDGFDDLIVGHQYDSYEGRPTFSGSIVGVYGSSSGLALSTKVTIDQDSAGFFGSDSEENDFFGSAVASGDFNGDGFDDVAVGIVGEDANTTSNTGAIAFFNGSFAGLSAESTIRFEGDFGGTTTANNQFAFSLASGNIDNDDYDDIIIGQPNKDISGVTNAGAISVARGSSSGINQSSTTQVIQQSNGASGSSETGDKFGWALAVGDFNGDDYDDVAVGSPFEDIGSTADSGDVRVFKGSASGLVTPNFTTFYSGADSNDPLLNDAGGSLEANDRVGYSLAAMKRCADYLEPNGKFSSLAPYPELTAGRYNGLGTCPDTTLFGDDVYAVEVPSNQILDVNIFFEDDNGDLDLKLRDSSTFSTELASSTGTSDKEAVTYVNNSGSTKTVLIHVFGYNKAVNRYNMTIDFRPNGCNDDLLEPNDIQASAVKIEVGTTPNLVQCNGGDEDVYWFTATAGQIIKLESIFTHASNSNVALELWDKDFNFKKGANTNSSNELLVYVAEYTGVYYAKSYLFPGSTQSNEYQLNLSFPSPLSVQFDVAATTVNEDAGTISIPVSLSASALGIEKVRFITDNGTAQVSADFTHQFGILTFSEGETTKSIEVPIIDDAIDEGVTPETFIAGIYSPTNVTIGTNKIITVSINDDDLSVTLPKVKFGASRYDKEEGTGNVRVTVELDQPATGNESIEYATSNGTAMAGSDYTQKSGTLSFNAGQTSKSFNIAIADDNLAEWTESFNISLSNPQNAQIESPSSTTVGIIDNDVPEINIEAATYSVSEGEGSVQITLVLDQTPLTVVGIDFITSNGSAIADSDYITVSGRRTFVTGEFTSTVGIPITDDTNVESNEKFTFTLIPYAGSGVTIGSTDSAEITIIDNDSADLPTVTLDTASISVNEGAGSVSIGVSLSKAAANDITLTYSTQNGSATAGSDFTGTGAGTKSVTFAAGTTKQSIVIPIEDDSTVESAETFQVLLQDAPGADPGAIGEITITINDNDSAGGNNFSVFLPVLTK